MEVPTIDAGVIRLRAWEPEDADWYVVTRDEDVFRWTREERDLDAARCRESIDRTRHSPDRAAFAIVDAATGSPLGNVGVTVHAHSVELSYWVAAGARGRGVAATALAAAAEWAASTFDKPRLELETHPGNLASQRVAERAGFWLVGLRPGRDECADSDGMVTHYERIVQP